MSSIVTKKGLATLCCLPAAELDTTFNSYNGIGKPSQPINVMNSGFIRWLVLTAFNCSDSSTWLKGTCSGS